MKKYGGRMEASSQSHRSVKSPSEGMFSLDPVSVCTNLQQVINAKYYSKYSVRTFALYTDFFLTLSMKFWLLPFNQWFFTIMDPWFKMRSDQNGRTAIVVSIMTETNVDK